VKDGRDCAVAAVSSAEKGVSVTAVGKLEQSLCSALPGSIDL